MEELDFSKAENQRKFDLSSSETKKSIIALAQTEANLLRRVIESGHTDSYEEALREISKPEVPEDGFSLIIDLNGDVYLDLGGGKDLVGNALEGATNDLPDGTTSIDLSIYDRNLKKIIERIMLMVDDLPGSTTVN